MKLIIRDYLAGLKEREELDIIIPDVLSQMRLNVFSRPSLGTRQAGVDVAAVGRIGSNESKVYLLTIKSGDLTRSNWDSGLPQDVRPSVNEILDDFIPHRLSEVHKSKNKVIVIALGGDVKEPVEPTVNGFIEQNTKDDVAIEVWNGDVLAGMIEKHLLSEKILQKKIQSKIRKALAMVEMPEISTKYSFDVLDELIIVQEDKPKKILKTLSQIYLCQCLLYAWAKEADNLESAYLFSERAVLYAWELAKERIEGNPSIQNAFGSILEQYVQISYDYFQQNVFPYVEDKYAISAGVNSINGLDINLKLFDILGRIASNGLLITWLEAKSGDLKRVTQLSQVLLYYCHAIKMLIVNNPILFSPIQEGQAIDINLACIFLYANDETTEFLSDWLNEIVERSIFNYRIDSCYPCVLNSYEELLDHPNKGDGKYKQEVTEASILYPSLLYWLIAANRAKSCEILISFINNELKHSTMQLWYPDESSEDNFYLNKSTHGKALVFSGIKSCKVFKTKIEKENDASRYFPELSAVKLNMLPLVAIACRHYRLPPPLQMIEIHEDSNQVEEG